MTQITRKGRELASKLDRSYPDLPLRVWHETLYPLCSLVCRHAATHRRLQETACNRELTPQEMTQEGRCEEHIRYLVERLPLVGGQPIRVKFQGDPRGYTVKLIMPDGRYDTWGGAAEGLGVPQ